MPTMRLGVVICFQGWIHHHSCQGLSTDTTFTGAFRSWSIIIWSQHYVKAFWIVHHIVCVCLIALTDALMFAMLVFYWQRAWRSCVFRDAIMTESSMRVVPSLSHMFVSRNQEWVFYHCDCPETRVFANSSLPDCQVIAYLWSCWDEPVIPVRCHISLRKSRVQLAVNDSMWNAGKGVLPVIVCNVHICGWTKLPRVMLVLFNTALDDDCWTCRYRCGLSPCISWWLPFRVFSVDRKSSFHCCLLVSGKHLSGIDWKRLNTIMNDALWTWMRMWAYSACGKSGKDGVIMLC